MPEWMSRRAEGQSGRRLAGQGVPVAGSTLAHAECPVWQWIVVGYHGFIGRAVVQCLRESKLHVYGVAHGQLDVRPAQSVFIDT